MKRNVLFKAVFVSLFTAFSLGGNAQNAHHIIKIVDFSIAKNANKVNINWATDNKNATNYFEVERSNDGKNFKTIAYVLGPDPARKDCDCYGYFDKASTNTKESYYRLKHTGNDGIVEFSEVKMLALR